MVHKKEREKELVTKAELASAERAGWLRADHETARVGLEDLFARQIKRGVIV